MIVAYHLNLLKIGPCKCNMKGSHWKRNIYGPVQEAGDQVIAARWLWGQQETQSPTMWAPGAPGLRFFGLNPQRS